MIERYALFDTTLVKKRFGTANTILGNFKKRYNVRPTQNMPVVLLRDGERRIEFKTWGLVPQNARDQNGVFRYKTYSVSEEDVFKKNSTEKIVRTQRCIVPVNGFYLWPTDSGDAQPRFVHLADYAPMGLAGIYSSWVTPDGVEQGTFAILTVASSGSLAAIGERAPVILEQADETSWLDPTLTNMTTVYNATKPYADNDLHIDVVSADINGKKIDTPKLIESIE
ncbi:MAG: SOS response-associated peptidase [Candidatus Saccharimonadales bacterium]